MKGKHDVRYEITWTELEENLTIRYAPESEQRSSSKQTDLTTWGQGSKE